MEVGGGFGCKLNVYNDEVLVAYASKPTGVPGQVDGDQKGGGQLDHPGTRLDSHRHA